MKRIEKLELYSSMLRYFLETRKSLSTKPAGFSLMLSPVEVLVLFLFFVQENVEFLVFTSCLP